MMLETAKKPVEHMFYRYTGHGHGYYWGDRHEAALTADYLQRTLGLSPLWQDTQGMPELRKALIADNQILAEGYGSEKGIVREDIEKFKHYSQLAVDLGDNDSQLYAANRLLDSLDISSPNLHQQSEKAIVMLKEASDKGFGEASAKLSHIIYERHLCTKKHRPVLSIYNPRLRTNRQLQKLSRVHSCQNEPSLGYLSRLR